MYQAADRHTVLGHRKAIKTEVVPTLEYTDTESGHSQ